MMHKNEQGGYTLLFSVLTATLVLGVAVFIVDLTRKQHELAVSARNSIYAFYAADGGIECAVSTSNWQSPGFASTTGGTLNCGGDVDGVVLAQSGCPQVYPASLIGGTPTNPIRQWCGYVSMKFPNTGTPATNGCAQVIITTGQDITTSQPKTIIDSRGYNLCTSAPAPDTAKTDTVERALRLIQTGVW